MLLLFVLTGCAGTQGTEQASPDEPAAAETGSPADTEGAAEDGEIGSDAVAHYPLETDFESSVVGAPPLETVGDVALVSDDDVSGSSAAEFASDAGLALDASELLAPDVYTFVFRFYLDSTSAGWLKLMDLHERSQDRGFYVYGKRFQFYPHGTYEGDPPLGGPPYATVALRRDADGRISWFVDGSHQADVEDDRGFGEFEPGTIHFFLDDTETNDSGREQSSGRLAWLSVYDQALSDAAIAELDDQA